MLSEAVSSIPSVRSNRDHNDTTDGLHTHVASAKFNVVEMNTDTKEA